MAKLPVCPTHREGKGCPRSDLRLAGETETFYTYHCATCGLEWVWTKPKTKAAAAYERELEKVRADTERDRERDSRPLTFGAPRGGWL